MGNLPLRKLPSRGGIGAPSGAGGLEHGPDPSVFAGKVRTYGTRALFVVVASSLGSLVYEKVNRPPEVTKRGEP
jgi:hypothetical protein